MKKINDFIDKAPLWKVYIFSYFLCSIMMFVMFHGMGQLLDPERLNLIVNLKIGAMSGIMFGLMLTLMISMMRKSQQFWDFSKEVDAKIKAANTRDAIIEVYENDFKQLKKMSIGGPHYMELNRLYTIMKTKLDYV